MPKQHKKAILSIRDQRDQNCPKTVKSSSLTIPISSALTVPHWYEFHTEIHCQKSLCRIGLTHQRLPGCNLDLISNDMCHVIFDVAMCVPNVNSDHLDLEQRQELLLFNPYEKPLQDPEKERSGCCSTQRVKNGHNSSHNCLRHPQKRGQNRRNGWEREKKCERGPKRPKTYLTMSGTNWQNSQVSVCGCPQPLPNNNGFLLQATAHCIQWEAMLLVCPKL